MFSEERCYVHVRPSIKVTGYHWISRDHSRYGGTTPSMKKYAITEPCCEDSKVRMDNFGEKQLGWWYCIPCYRKSAHYAAHVERRVRCLEKT